ncbi:MAG: FAD-dependent oxidoreductase [Campylobacterota bacterium]|nr:FAD-dependent oxidoreductase [Campylobacterota bacterium]
MFDVAIIGAGINGTATAHFLTQAGLKVALFDREGIAKGGSGAAGAFISPKISKGGPLKALIEEAYLYSLSFFRDNFPQHITLSPQLHIAKYDDDNEKVAYFKTHTNIPVGDVPAESEALLQDAAKAFASVYIKNSGVVDTEKTCKRLSDEAEFFLEEITAIERVGEMWRVGPITAEKVVLATGAYIPVVDEAYIKLRAIWGHRINIRTTTTVPHIIHHQVSLAPTTPEGLSAIGATHNVHYHPQLSDERYDMDAGRAELIKKATESVKLENIEVVADFVGLRSGSNDYLPLLGRIADTAKSIDLHPELLKGVKVPKEELVYHPNLYMINGVGGYGFVLGPYLAKQLSAHLINRSALDEQLDPTRFLYRWAKKQK